VKIHNFLLILNVTLLCLSGCGVFPSEPDQETPRFVSPVVDVTSKGVHLFVNKEDFQIKEICIGDKCQFRQKCGRVRPILVNNTDYDIKITEVARRRFKGETKIGEKYYEVPEEGFILKAHSGGEENERPVCHCSFKDKVCTKEFPLITSPFLVGVKEQIEISYMDHTDAAYTVSAEGIYEAVKVK